MSEEGEQKSRMGAWVLMSLALGWRMLRGWSSKSRSWKIAQRASAGLPTGREADLEQEAVTPERKSWGTFIVGCLLIAAIVAGIGFLFIYWTDGSNQLLGGTLALSLAGFGFALVFWSHWLMSHKEATDPREPLPSPPEEREEAAEDFCAGARDVQRRSLLKWMVGAGVGVFAAMFVSLLRSFGAPVDIELFSIVWRKGQRLLTADGKPISVSSLQAGDSVTVFPEGSLGDQRAQTVLIRVKQNLLQLPADRAQWAPDGYVAYSRVCTHAGCPVGLFEAQTNLLLCPCHQSTFDVLRAATPTGGPAARPLPQLPLYVDGNGELRAGGRFSATPGPGFWGMR